MRYWALSDTHCLHRQINIPNDIDTVIFAGDSTNHYNWVNNQPEFEDFIDWFCGLKIQNKILIAGNHDAWATKKYNVDRVKELGIIYLEHESIVIDGKVIFGSPYTPTFGQWHFMKDRAKLDQYWMHSIEKCDILVTHGPPASILDLSENKQHQLEQCGDVSLYKRVMQHKPKIHIFGHIHDYQSCKNQGVLFRNGIWFMNVSCVEDGRFDKGPTSHGLVFDYEAKEGIRIRQST